MDGGAAIATAQVVKGAFLLLTALALTSYKYPPHRALQDGTTCDYVIVGAGTAGSVLAYRLTEDPGVTVCVIEAGGDPAVETSIPSVFPFLTMNHYDWNLTSENDGYTAQYRRNPYLDLPTGKGLGGSSVMHHFYHLRGDRKDYDDWAIASGDDAWSWKNLLPYLIKTERVDDPFIINSETGKYHGTNGYVGLTRETRTLPLKYLEAFKEVGHKVVEDINGGNAMGFTRPMFSISGGVRQDAAESCLAGIRNRENLYIMKNTMANKIIFDGNKQATGVQCTASDGNDITINARKEVIMAAGVFQTPKLLMLSGVGPQDHLDSMGIEVISALPVGKNLQDHMAVVLVNLLEAVNDVPESQDPHLFPTQTFVGFGAVNKSQSYPDYMTLNLINRNTPSVLLILCTVVLGLHVNICKQIATAGVNREVLFTVFNVARPKSRGEVLLRSTNPADPPKIYTGFLSDTADLQKYIEGIQDYTRVTQSAYFRDVGGETMHFNFPSCNGVTPNTTEYWTCYILNMMDTTFQYSSTCPMGPVLDSNLLVKGVSKVRVVDASAMPNLTSGELYPAVLALAEKAADLIKRAQACA